MSTRSSISVATSSGIKSVYCHWDGYLSGVGEKLVLYHDSLELALQLVEHGAISSFDQVGTPDYYSDRGEKVNVTKFHSFADWSSLKAKLGSDGYDYIWIDVPGDGGHWYVSIDGKTPVMVEGALASYKGGK